MLTTGPVVVMQVPEQYHSKEVRSFTQELQPLLEGHRPRIVLDCSQVRYMDSAGVESLLHSLEEAMKRDGDLKLAAVSREASVILQLMRVDRVFEAHSTCAGAVNSFAAVPVEAVPQSTPWIANMFGDFAALKQAS